MLNRLKLAAKILLRGEPQKKNRNPIPVITAEEVAEARAFFPRGKFFIFGHARSGTTLLMRLARLHPILAASLVVISSPFTPKF